MYVVIKGKKLIGAALCLIIVAAAVISWIGVTAIPCPNPIVARPTGPAFSLVCSSAVVSPGKSIPVVPVIPKVPKCS